MEAKKTAYQKQGIIRYLCDVLKYNYIDIIDIVEQNNVDTLRYHYHIPNDNVNEYWYKAMDC